MNELTPDEHKILVDAIHDSASVIHKGQRMNERITELMLEAGKTILGDKHIDADFCKKFAELIVRECIDNIRQNMEYAKVESTAHDPTEFKTILEKSGHFFINELKQHFDIK
jgi:hypothetical protein